MEFHDRIVLITGAGGGIGATVTRRWLDSGAKVVAIGGSAASVDRLGSHDRLATAAFDLASENGPDEMVRFAHSAFGAPDTLIHLVGGFAMAKLLDGSAPEVWESMMRQHATIPFRVFRSVLPSMRRAGRGDIVAITSKSASVPSPGMSAYSAGKAALNALARSLDSEVKADGIRVNLISVGMLDTPDNRAAMGKPKSDWVTADEIAEATFYLCSPKSRPVRGSILELHG